MRTIHKYPLHARGGEQVIELSPLAQVLHVEAQGDDPLQLSVWVDLDDSWPRRNRWFEFFVTGRAVPTDARYVTTLLFDNGRFVRHLYEVYV